MDPEDDEEYWKPRVLALRAEGSALGALYYKLEDEGKITEADHHAAIKASNDIEIRRGGSVTIQFNAVNFGLMRHANHRMRQVMIERHPELAEEINRLAPPVTFDKQR